MSEAPPPPSESTAGVNGAGGWRRYLPLADGHFTATAIIAPVIVAVIGLGITVGFSWIGDKFKEDEPLVYATASRSPRIAHSVEPSRQPSGPASPWGAPGLTESGQADQPEAEAQGIQSQRSGYLCPWDAWVVRRPPSDFDDVPVLKDGRPHPDLINDDIAGDPGNTHLSIDVQPVDSRPMQVKELRIKILERKQAPTGDEATLVGLQRGGCGGGPTTMIAHADLDGGADFATVRFEGKEELPQELVGGRALSIELTVETRSCDCVWVPEIVWSKNGEVKTTEFRTDGKELRTIAPLGLERRAWQQDLNTLKWSRIPFDETILD